MFIVHKQVDNLIICKSKKENLKQLNVIIPLQVSIKHNFPVDWILHFKTDTSNLNQQFVYLAINTFVFRFGTLPRL